jgi:hypothetical protein
MLHQAGGLGRIQRDALAVIAGRGNQREVMKQ